MTGPVGGSGGDSPFISPGVPGPSAASPTTESAHASERHDDGGNDDENGAPNEGTEDQGTSGAESSARPIPKTRQEYEAEERGRFVDILRRLRAGEFAGSIKVILVIGASGSGKTNLIKLITGQDILVGHGFESGTRNGHCLLTYIREEQFLFIDTPGFGHPDTPLPDVKSDIYNKLGYFTRCLGGVHGILYVHDITTDRTSPGMKDSVEFLRSLFNNNNRIATFVTTKWDAISAKEARKREAKEAELMRNDWGTFAIGSRNGAHLLHTQVDCDKDDAAEIAAERLRVQGQILRWYGGIERYKMVMPFSEWTPSEQVELVLGYIGRTIRAVTSPIWYPIKLFARGFMEGKFQIRIAIGVSQDGRFMAMPYPAPRDEV